MKDFFFDFHLHSCLSPCGSDDMTPADLAGMCALAGYDMVALTDHNSTANCPAFCRAADHYGLLALPGMELTTSEEVHVICLFPDLSSADQFGTYVRRRLPAVPNRPDLFGRQLILDEEDRLLGEEPLFLLSSSCISICEVHDLVAALGGVSYPAHIDRPSFSLLSNLGLWVPEAGFSLAELSLTCPDGFTSRPDLAGLRFLTGCDAHYLHEIPEPTQTLSLPERSIPAALDALR